MSCEPRGTAARAEADRVLEQDHLWWCRFLGAYAPRTWFRPATALGVARRWLLHVVVVVALAIGGVVGQQVRASALPPETQVFIDEGLALLPDLDCSSFVLSERLVSERLQVTTFSTTRVKRSGC